MLASQTGVSNVSNEVITLNKSSGVVLEVTDGKVALNGSGIVLDASSGDILASSFQGAFSGNGSGITVLNLGQANNSGQVPIARGGTGASSLSGSSIPYVNSSGIFEESKIGYNPSTHITSISSNVVISGNLTVAGNITAQHTTDHYITDKIFAVAHNNTVDAKDMGQHMTRPTANVFAGFLGQTMSKEYTIAFTESNSESETIVPTNTTADGYITANVWGNVLSGNVTTTGKVTADSFHGDGSSITNLDLGDATNTGQVATARGGTGVTTGLTVLNATNLTTGTVATARGGTGVTTGISVLNPANLSSQVLLAKGGTGLTTVAENELLLGPASGTALTKLTPYTGPAVVTVPPSGMSSTTQTIGGIQYTSSASSTMSGLATNNAFDHNNATIWRTGLMGDYGSSNGTYYGSDTTGSYSGEWIQLYRATAIAPTSIQIIPAQATFAGPSVWKVFGSTNGSSWTEIHSSTTIVPWNSGNGSTETITGSAAYNYLRLAINKSAVPNSMGTVAVSEVRFTGPPPPSNNVLSFNTTTGEIYDSGGQGGSTLDNVHEYKANISIGPSVAAANLTINVFESNVLTVSGNVSADSITIGSLHVAASPFSLDDVSQATVGANVTSNVIQFTGPHSSYNSDNAFVTTNSIKIGSNVNVTGNLISQNIQLTNPGITATMSSTDTITIDAKNKSYGTAPLVQLAGDLNSLVYSDLIDGAQIVVPIFASGADRKISKNLTNVNWYVQTSDLTIKQSEHGLMTLSNVAGNVYMNSISFTQN